MLGPHEHYYAQRFKKQCYWGSGDGLEHLPLILGSKSTPPTEIGFNGNVKTQNNKTTEIMPDFRFVHFFTKKRADLQFVSFIGKTPNFAAPNGHPPNTPWWFC